KSERRGALMSEILTPEQVEEWAIVAAHGGQDHHPASPEAQDQERISMLATSHEALRAKLTEVERERDAALSGSYYDQRMPLFMTQLAAARGRAEQAEAALAAVTADRDRLAAEVGRLANTLRGIVSYIDD